MIAKLEPFAARDAALAGARAAATLLRSASRPTSVRAKSSPRDLVTEWDLRCEAAIVAELGVRAPGVPVLGEEEGARGSGDARFIVDPIDGTVNFVHGLPFYGVSVAYEAEGRVLGGAVIAPGLGWEFTAARGLGAFKDGVRLQVSPTARVADALLATGFPPDRRVSAGSNLPEFVHLKRLAGGVRRIGSASLDLCFVAAGWFDGYWERGLKPWDVAAGFLLVEEAGGRVTDSAGGPATLDGADFVATNGVIHEELRVALTEVPLLAPW